MHAHPISHRTRSRSRTGFPGGNYTARGSDEATALEGTLEDPSVLQAYLRRSFKGTGKVERLMLDNAVPVEEHPYDRDSPDRMGLWERHQA